MTRALGTSQETIRYRRQGMLGSGGGLESGGELGSGVGVRKVGVGGLESGD